MSQTPDVRSLTEFARHARDHSDRLVETGRPEVLTVDGTATLVVQSADAYEKLLERIEELESLAAIQEGTDTVQHGIGRPAREVLEGIKADLDDQRER